MASSRSDLSKRMLFWEFYDRGFQQAARQGWWKVIRLKHSKPLKLFNLKKDVGEKNDVAKANPQIVAMFEKQMKAARTPSRSWPTPID